MRKNNVYERHCNQCKKYYKGFGRRFCSVQCSGAWQREHPKGTLTKRFWDKVQIKHPNDCWEWTASKSPLGYGQIGAYGKTRPAHRVVWMLTVGPIPDGLCVLHKCDNRSCVNINHLFLGTQQDNIADMISKGRNVSHPGERSGASKLTEQDVLSIRTLSRQGMTQTNIAKQFNVKQSQVSKIILRQFWKHI